MEQTPYRAIFFDLDGTLLPMDINEFMQAYFSKLAGFVEKHGIDPQTFKTGLKAGIGAMAAQESTRPNADVYWEAFFSVADEGALDWISLLDEFYEHEFGTIGATVVPDPAAARAIEVLSAKGYPLVLATMPMFPQRAVEWRLAWAGIDPAMFSRMTHFENSTSVKPKLAYFAENLRACGCKPEEVLMVGNNTKEDLVCLDLGMDAYLITTHLLDPIGFDISSVKNGSMADFVAWAEGLPACENPASGIEVACLLDSAAGATARGSETAPGGQRDHAISAAIDSASVNDAAASKTV